MNQRPPSRRKGSRGQGLVELALVLPVFLTMLFGILDVGRVVWANDALANAAREAARYAIVHGGSSVTYCPVGPPAFFASQEIYAPAAGCPAWNPDSKEPIRAIARQYAIAGGTAMTVQVCYGSGCTGDTDLAIADNSRGTPVTVRVSSTVPIFTGSLLRLGNFAVSGTSTMLVNN